MSPADIRAIDRAVDLERLCDRELDILVVGGGVVGAGIALDAATRGLSVGLVEAQDFASGTSSRSTKLIHGGLRYLKMFDFHLVHEALKERGLLLERLAPHLVRKLPICYPLRVPLIERAYTFAGISLYEALGWSTGSSRGVPRQRQLSRNRLYAENPGLRHDAFVGGIEYYDAQVDDARFVITLLRTARAYGAVVLSRVAAVSLQREGERVVGATVKDVETGGERQVRARAVVFATGVWTEEVEELVGREHPLAVRPSKGIHLTVLRERIPLRSAIATGTEKSILFVLPWGEHWIIGTTDTPWDQDKSRPVATAADIDYLLAHVNTLLERPITRSDVQSVFAGLRPLVAESETETTKVSREHAVACPAPGLVAISGGKYTTYRIMARDAVDAAVEKWPKAPPPSKTDVTPLLGAAGPDELSEAVDFTMARACLDRTAAERLVGRYGTLVTEVLAPAGDDASLLRPIGGSAGALRAEVRYAVTHEGALHLEDVLRRRLRLELETADRGALAADEAAAVMASVLGWTCEERHVAVDRFRRLIECERRAEREPDDASAAQVMKEFDDDAWPLAHPESSRPNAECP